MLERSDIEKVLLLLERASNLGVKFRVEEIVVRVRPAERRTQQCLGGRSLGRITAP